MQKKTTSASVVPRSIEENPWIRRASREIYSNPWIRLREDSVVTPAGREGIYGVIEFANVAVGVLPLDCDGFTYLVGQFRYALGRASWEIPEGGCPQGEEPLAAARRELREETGLEATTWEPLMELDLSNSVTDERAVVFIARGLAQREASPEDTEVLNVRRLPLMDAVAMAERGEIRDAISVAALFRARVLLLEGRLAFT